MAPRTIPSTRRAGSNQRRAAALIRDAVTAGRNVLVVAHGNTIRAFDELLRGGSGERLDRVPTAHPLLYEWNGNPAGVQRTMFTVSNQAPAASKIA